MRRDGRGSAAEAPVAPHLRREDAPRTGQDNPDYTIGSITVNTKVGSFAPIASRIYRIYNKYPTITFDPGKRAWTLRERGLDFLEAETVFAGETIDIPDLRRDYGEPRINSVGSLRGRMVIICWTPRGDTRHVISMREGQ